MFIIRAKQAQDGPASFAGIIYSDKGAPLAGIKVSIGRTPLVSTTDDQGKFQLDNVPPGRIDLFVDGRTYNPNLDQNRAQYPSLHFEAHAIKGQANQIAHPIYLPALAIGPDSAKQVGGNEDVILTLPGLEGFKMIVKANSVTFPDGARVGTLVISPVTADKLPMAPPAGGAQFGVPAWTIQPSGTRFDPPIEVQMPNATGEIAGDNLPVVQWDHDLGQYVPMGRATVSGDGAILITDAGSGITKAGWGGLCRYDECKTSLPKEGCGDCKKVEYKGNPPCPECVVDATKNGTKCDGDECKECKNGACIRKPDKELGSVDAKIDIQVFSRYVDGIADRLDNAIKLSPLGAWVSEFQLVRPKITGAVTGTALERCCKNKTTDAVRISGGIEFSPGGISIRIRPPTWRIPDPFEPTRDLAGIGVLGEVRFAMTGNASGIKADCDCGYNVFVGGQIRATLAAYLELNSSGRTMSGTAIGSSGRGSRLLDVQGGVSYSVRAGAKLDCNGFTPDSYQFGPLEMIVKLTAGDLFEKTVRIPVDGFTFSGP